MNMRGRGRAGTLAGMLAVSMAAAASRAGALYFDVSGASPGSGLGTGTYSWDATTANWSPDPDGASAAVQTWDPAATAVFSAGADATGSLLVNIRTSASAAGITAEDGTVTIGPTSASLNLTGGTVDVPSAARTLSLRCAIAGTTFTKVGSGTVVLIHASSSFTGGFAVTGGTVQFDEENGQSGGVASRTGLTPTSVVPDYVRLDGGTIRNTSVVANTLVLSANKGITLGPGGGTIDIADSITTNVHVYGGVIAGAGPLTKTGPGLLVLGPQPATYSGATSVAQGTLRLSAHNVLPAGTAVTVAGGTTLDLFGYNQAVGSLAGTGKVIATAPGRLTVAPSADATWAGVISGGGGLTVSGPAFAVVAAPQTYTGPTLISGASPAAFGIRLGAAGALPTLPDLQFYAADAGSSPTLDLNGFSQAVTNIINLRPGVGHPGVTNTSATPATLTINNSQGLAIDVPITGAVTLAKTGSTTLVLTAANTYSGPTRVAAGVLAVSNAGQLGNGGPANAISLEGGTLRTDAPLSTSRALSLPLAAGTIDTNGFDATLSGTANGGGTLAKAGAGTLTLGPLSLGGLTINAGQVRLIPGTGTSTLSTLTVAGGAKFDAADNRLVLTGIGPAGVATMLAAGRVGTTPGDWLGVTGIASSAAAADPGKSTAIGYATAAQLGVTTWGTATGLTGAETVTKYTYYGDLNLDGRVNADDFVRIDRSIAKGGLAGSAVWIDGDVNYDGAVTAADYLLMDRAFALHGGPLSPATLADRESRFGSDYVTYLVASIPEPAAPSVAAVTLALAPIRRRHRR